MIDKKELKIMFMGTPEIAAHILEGLITEGYQIVGLVAQEDKPVGRKKEIVPVPTKVIATKYNIPVYQVKRIREDYHFVKELNPDLIVTCAYGQIVPQGLLDIPRFKSLNVHGSLLPKYRGAAPIQAAIQNGDRVSGVTIMEMIDKMDAGKMYYKEEIEITEDDNYSSLYHKMAIGGLKALLTMLPLYLNNELPGEEQNEEEVTYCNKVLKDDEHLDLSLGASSFINQIRSLADQPGGYLLLNNQIIKIFKAKLSSNSVNGEIGQIIKADKEGLIIQLKDGQIAILELQKQGRKRVYYKDFINGEKNLCTMVFK